MAKIKLTYINVIVISLLLIVTMIPQTYANALEAYDTPENLIIMQVGLSREVEDTISSMLFDLRNAHIPYVIIRVATLDQLIAILARYQMSEISLVAHANENGILVANNEISWATVATVINQYRTSSYFTHIVTCYANGVRKYLDVNHQANTLAFWSGAVDTEVAAKLATALVSLTFQKLNHAANLLRELQNDLLPFVLNPRLTLYSTTTYSFYTNFDQCIAGTPYDLVIIANIVNLVLHFLSLQEVIGHLLLGHIMILISIAITIVELLFILLDAGIYWVPKGVVPGMPGCTRISYSYITLIHRVEKFFGIVIWDEVELRMATYTRFYYESRLYMGAGWLHMKFNSHRALGVIPVIGIGHIYYSSSR